MSLIQHHVSLLSEPFKRKRFIDLLSPLTLPASDLESGWSLLRLDVNENVNQVVQDTKYEFIPCLFLLLVYQILLSHQIFILSSLHVLQLELKLIYYYNVVNITLFLSLTVVSLSRAANLSSWAEAAFSKASCFLIRFSTSSMVCPYSSDLRYGSWASSQASATAASLANW